MGLFGNIFRGTKYLFKTSFYFGSFYTFLAYFYVQEIKYKLGDTAETDRINKKMLEDGLTLDWSNYSDVAQLLVQISLNMKRIYTFYARAWNFREFDLVCKQFHGQIIRSVLKNYESYGILDNCSEMQKSLKKNQVNPETLKKILQVKEVNTQLISSAFDIYMGIIDKQITMSTGSILGLTMEEEGKINLIYNYVERGLLDLSANKQDEYWKYKLTQSEIRKHPYNDTIFKLVYI